MADVNERNARLDALTKATTTWAARRREELSRRVALSKSILRGRTGAERLVRSSVEAATPLVVAEIDEFLLPSG